MSWTFYPVFFGTAISIASLTHFAITQRGNLKTRTLSELAVTEQKLLVRFRNILLFCGSLFAISMFGFIVPRVPHPLPTLILSIAIITGELLAGVIPAHASKIGKLHEYLAALMGYSMLVLPYLLWFSFSGSYKLSEALLAVFMTVLGGLMLRDTYRRNFVAYELLFIFSSHISIVVAALALRAG
jgi:hypothetical protein